MKGKVVVLLSLVGVLVVVTSLSIQYVKKTSEASMTEETRVESINIGEKTTPIKKEEKEKAPTVIETEHVITEATYPLKSIEDSVVSPDMLPQGTVVSVKDVEGTAEWVEIISDPPKGFVEKRLLAPRQSYVAEREAKRKPKLTTAEFTETLTKALTEFTNEKGGQISVAVETTDGSLVYGHNSETVRRTASSIKLPFIAYVMSLVDSGQVELSTRLTYTSNFTYGGTGILQFEPVGTEYSIERLAELVIRYSDNVAYFMLVNHIGEQAFIEFLTELDPNTPRDRYYSTARILNQAMKYVYTHQETSENMGKLFDWIQDSTFDDGVAVGLPGVDVAHKTGWMPMYTVSNDISLVLDEQKPYFLTIMTSGYDDSYSEQSIGDIAKIVDDHLLRVSYDS